MWSGFLPKLIGTRVVEISKITDYLLAADHPQGGPKASFLARFGFVPEHATALRDALHAHPDHNDIARITETPFGTRHVIECNIVSPDGRNPCIRSVWIRDHGTKRHRLVTAYPIA